MLYDELLKKYPDDPYTAREEAYYTCKAEHEKKNPVLVSSYEQTRYSGYCPNCRKLLPWGVFYCSQCGQAVKWPK